MPTDGKKSAKQREELDKKVEDFKEKFKTDGDHLVHHVFPSKILELEDIYQSLHVKDAATYHTDLNIPVPDPVLFYNNDTSEPSQPDRKRKKLEHNNDDKVEDIAGTKVQILPNGPVPCNKRLAVLADQIKPYIQELIDHANILKMWITLLIPKIEDGNNFGVSVQEDTLGEARQVESEAASYLDQISRYYITRAKLVSKVAKYPHLDDYRQSVRELDEKEFISIRLISCELRNHYASLHDIILKNMEKIKKPKNDNAHQNLY
ncbi:proteasome activator complex subunit 3-like [Mytilus trossulus]|uniref:proteasome activator complex subunit 3-like n=1 Tax=Mytilus trossulus TaxID=6551 RepID=UPI003004D159